ncbi:IMPACT family protein [Mesoplasma syrphidae]|uniref:IMPACT family protein n=1 Tax=Mesoplasma syrphidae TaxID=225999 RepID=UPI0004792C2B|nr:YigZ family protein [Mesoplasma syrphidae]
MKTISKGTFQNSFEIKKSKFITIAAQINSKEELIKFLLKYRDLEAQHNCYAYKIGVTQQQGGFSDDSEPAGTAGKPIFNVIEKMELTNIAVLVIRHFGGTKLGAGPLTRAYTTSASELLNSISLINLQKAYKISFSFSIRDTKKVDAFLRQNDLLIKQREYNHDPTYTVVCQNPKIFEALSFLIANFKQEQIYIEMI